MADADALRSYRRGPSPTLDGGDREYFIRELESIERSFTTVIAVIKKLEARLVAHGI
jgi:hypothetical protein